jgi:hypothetical protein
VEKVKISDRFTVTDEDLGKPSERWEIVNEVGVGRWLGQVVEEYEQKQRLTLQPAFELSSPSHIPSLVNHPSKGTLVAVCGGTGVSFVLEQPSDHPIRDLKYSSRQRCCEMSEDLRIALFNAIATCVMGELGPDGKRHKNT